MMQVYGGVTHCMLLMRLFILILIFHLQSLTISYVLAFHILSAHNFTQIIAYVIGTTEMEILMVLLLQSLQLCTMDDHHQEVIAFCRENNYHGLMAEDAEYIIFDPPRYFSSHQLKLTYKVDIITCCL